MNIILTCPLGSECEEIRDNKIYRCRWYVEMRGTDATGEEHDRRDCAISWQPILQVEAAGATRQVSTSVQSLRNEQVKGQNKLYDSVHKSSIENKLLILASKGET